MLFNTKFDLVISLGEDCACSSYLRRFNLQRCSFPFDWLTYAPFKNRIDLLCNNILKISYDNISFQINPRWNEVMGHEQNNNKVFSQIKIRYSFSQLSTFILYKLMLFFVQFIPIKYLRKNLRNKLQEEYLHAKL